MNRTRSILIGLALLSMLPACFGRPATRSQVSQVSRPPDAEVSAKKTGGVEIIAAPPEAADDDDGASEEARQGEEASSGSFLDTLVEPGYALVYSDTWFYTDATLDAPRVRMDSERLTGASAYVLIEVVREVNGMLEVVNAASWEVGCGASQLWGSLDYALRFYVEPSDIAPVIQETWSTTYPDGTGVTLYPGLVVEPAADGRARFDVHYGTLEIAIELPDEIVGERFDPVAYERPWEVVASIPSGGDVVLNGESWGVNEGYSLSVYAIEDRDQDSLVTTWGTCVETTFAASGQDIEPLPTSGAGGLGMLGTGYGGGGGTYELIPQGAEVTWPDGRVAGAARNEVIIQDWSSRDATRACFDVIVNPFDEAGPPIEERTFSLCVDPALIVEKTY